MIWILWNISTSYRENQPAANTYSLYMTVCVCVCCCLYNPSISPLGGWTDYISVSAERERMLIWRPTLALSLTDSDCLSLSVQQSLCPTRRRHVGLISSTKETRYWSENVFSLLIFLFLHSFIQKKLYFCSKVLTLSPVYRSIPLTD